MTNTDREFGWGDRVIFFESGLALLGVFENYTSDGMAEIRADDQGVRAFVPVSDVLMLNPRTDRVLSRSETHRELAARVKEHGGEWVCVEEIGISNDPHSDKEARARLSNHALLMKQGRLKSFQPRGCYDARSLRERDSNGNAVYRVYVRYAGLDGVLAVAEELLG
jgi:hypothetical protein